MLNLFTGDGVIITEENGHVNSQLIEDFSTIL